MTEDAVLLLRRYLAQRGELGETELLLNRFSTLDVGSLLDVSARLGEASGTEESSPRELLSALKTSQEQISEPSGPAIAPAVAALTDDDLKRVSTLDELRELAVSSTHFYRGGRPQSVVFGEGAVNSDLMVIGEAPGTREAKEGRPFIGSAGQLLNKLLAAIGFERDEVYICNVLKCRPLVERSASPAEIEASLPFLYRQIELIQPRVILALGAFSAQTLLGNETQIGQLRGTVFDFRGVPLVPTYHPAALLRNPVWIRPVWEDLQRLREILDGVE